MYCTDSRRALYEPWCSHSTALDLIRESTLRDFSLLTTMNLSITWFPNSKLSQYLRLSDRWLSQEVLLHQHPRYTAYCLPFHSGTAGLLISGTAVFALRIKLRQTDATRSAEGVKMAWFLSQQWSIPVNSSQESAPRRKKEPTEA